MNLKAMFDQVSKGIRSPSVSRIPLHARVNGLLQYQATPILKAQMAGSIMDAPPDGDQVIRAISHLKGDFGNGIWRLHTQIGDPLRDDNRFIQLFLRPDDVVEEAVLYSRLYGFVPEVDDLDDYDGSSGHGLGGPTWTLTHAELQSIGLSPSELQAIGDPDALVYQRDTPDASGTIAPYRGTESRITDTNGAHALFADIRFMLYQRALTESLREMLMIQRTIERDPSGRATRVYIMAWIGIPIEPQRVTIV